MVLISKYMYNVVDLYMQQNTCTLKIVASPAVKLNFRPYIRRYNTFLTDSFFFNDVGLSHFGCAGKLANGEL